MLPIHNIIQYLRAEPMDHDQQLGIAIALINGKRYSVVVSMPKDPNEICDALAVAGRALRDWVIAQEE